MQTCIKRKKGQTLAMSAIMMARAGRLKLGYTGPHAVEFSVIERGDGDLLECRVISLVSRNGRRHWRRTSRVRVLALPEEAQAASIMGHMTRGVNLA